MRLSEPAYFFQPCDMPANNRELKKKKKNLNELRDGLCFYRMDMPAYFNLVSY